jgi:hypothetical protein
MAERSKLSECFADNVAVRVFLERLTGAWPAWRTAAGPGRRFLRGQASQALERFVLSGVAQAPLGPGETVASLLREPGAARAAAFEKALVETARSAGHPLVGHAPEPAPGAVDAARAAWGDAAHAAAAAAAACGAARVARLEPGLLVVDGGGPVGASAGGAFGYRPATEWGRARLAALAARGGPEVAAACVLRYEAVGATGEQWGLPAAHHAALEATGFRFEGFASPLNARQFAPGRYCSAFPDTDAPLGSLGSFFGEAAREAAESDPAAGWAVNPPFAEDLLEQAAARSAEIARDGGRVAALFPHWLDAAGFRRADRDAALRLALPAGGYRLADPGGREFTPPFDLHYFGFAPPGAPRADRDALWALLRTALDMPQL